MIQEIWKDIPNYEGFYQVSSLGRVRSLDRIVECKNGVFKKMKGKLLVNSIDCTGYYTVKISSNEILRKTFKVHQLVAITFFNHKPNGYVTVVNHIDFNTLNNNINNLELISQRENTNRKHFKSTSKYTGVHWNKKSNKWRSSIYIKGLVRNLGDYDNEVDAYNAYKKSLKNIIK